jgi:hypothetical protein
LGTGPPIKVVKRMFKAEVAKVTELVNQNDQIQKDLELTNRKLLSLKDDNRKLALALQVESKSLALLSLNFLMT